MICVFLYFLIFFVVVVTFLAGGGGGGVRARIKGSMIEVTGVSCISLRSCVVVLCPGGEGE